MIYGMYLSATGVMTNTHQQDVIANNIANSDTNGFKRSMALVRSREVEAKAMRAAGLQNKLLDNIGGGQLLSPTWFDLSQGTIEQTGNPLDTAMSGKGFLAVRDSSNETRLTRAGALMINVEGNLVTPQGYAVLDVNQKPISLVNVPAHELSIGSKGEIRRGQEQLAQLGLFDSSRGVRPVGENLMALGDNARLVPATGKLVSGALEKSNVEPANELTRLMEVQRLLEANANMIKYQDSTLAKLVNEVGKIG